MLLAALFIFLKLHFLIIIIIFNSTQKYSRFQYSNLPSSGRSNLSNTFWQVLLDCLRTQSRYLQRMTALHLSFQCLDLLFFFSFIIALCSRDLENILFVPNISEKVFSILLLSILLVVNTFYWVKEILFYSLFSNKFSKL